MLIYCISGGAKSGKTTLAHRLTGRLPGTVWDLRRARESALDFYANLEMRLRQVRALGLIPRLSLDGIDSLEEVQFLREKFPADTIIHWHVVNGNIEDEPTMEQLKLALQSDYAVNWRKIHG